MVISKIVRFLYSFGFSSMSKQIRIRSEGSFKIWLDSFCLCPCKRTPGINGLKYLRLPITNINCMYTSFVHVKLWKWRIPQEQESQIQKVKIADSVLLSHFMGSYETCNATIIPSIGLSGIQNFQHLSV